MNVLINASNIKKGGGLQVADSICRELKRFTQHEFTVALPTIMCETRKAIENDHNVKVTTYDFVSSKTTFITGRDAFLDGLVKERKIESVLTIFGPSVWIPRCPHLCGFARAQLIIPESPYYSRMSSLSLLKQKIKYGLKELAFKRCSKNFYTEAPFATDRLEKKWKGKNIYTVTNYYNQVFDDSNQWKDIKLSPFDGTTLLTITAAYPHKNLSIAAEAARLLRREYPDFHFRFVFTINKQEYDGQLNDVENCFEFIGKVDISECPLLYKQSDIIFQPTLLECFTAAYAEAMRMEKPIVTTDLEFAHSLCGEAALYYSAIDVNACANAIYKVATNEKLRKKIVEKGKEQLNNYDNYKQRAEKLISLTEKIAR